MRARPEVRDILIAHKNAALVADGTISVCIPELLAVTR